MYGTSIPSPRQWPHTALTSLPRLGHFTPTAIYDVAAVPHPLLWVHPDIGLADPTKRNPVVVILIAKVLIASVAPPMHGVSGPMDEMLETIFGGVENGTGNTMSM